MKGRDRELQRAQVRERPAEDDAHEQEDRRAGEIGRVEDALADFVEGVHRVIYARGRLPVSGIRRPMVKATGINR
jgi:hypothetical protein